MSRRVSSLFIIALCLLALNMGALWAVRAVTPDAAHATRVTLEPATAGRGFTASAQLVVDRSAAHTRSIWFGSVGEDAQQLGLVWQQDPNDWFERWALWLVDGEGWSNGHGPLGYLALDNGRTYQMTLAYDAESGAVGYRIQDLATGSAVTGAISATRGRDFTQVGVAVTGESEADLPQIEWLKAHENFVPLGMSFHLLQRDADAERFSAFSTVDRHREAAIELTLPWGVLPGEGRLVVTDAGRELAHIVISELEDGLLIPVETRDWAVGTVGLRLDYVREGETVTIEEKAMPVGVIKVSVEDLAPITTEGKQTTWQGVLRLDSDGPTDDVSLKLSIRRTDYRPDLPNGSVITRETLAETTIRFADETTYRLPFSYTMETPDSPWSLAMEPTIETTASVQGYVPEEIQELYYGRLPDKPMPVMPERLRIALYNIRYARGIDGEVDLARVAQVLLDHEVDLVAFNEVDYGWPRSDRVDQPAVLSEMLSMPYFYFMPGAQRFSPFLEGHGHAIMTALPIAKALGKYLPRVGNREFRGAIGAEIPLTGDRTLHVWVTHLAHGGNFTDAQLRLLQAEALLQLAAGNELALIMGDMNAVPAEQATRAFLEAGWVDIWTKLGEGPGWTFPSDYPDRRIDYIYATPALAEAFVSIEVPETTASDHRPVIAEIDLSRLP